MMSLVKNAPRCLPLTNNRKRRKRSDYGPDLPIHKDFNIGHWRGFMKEKRLRRCNNCGREGEYRGTACKRWNREKKQMTYCGTMKLVREPVFIVKRDKDE